MSYTTFGAPNPELLASILKDIGKADDSLPTVLPPPPFLLSTQDAYALMRGQYDQPRRIDGVAFRQSFNMPSGGADRERLGHSLSESRLTSSAGRLADDLRPELPRVKSSGSVASSKAYQRSAVSRSAASTRSRKSAVSRCVSEAVSRVVAEDPMWKTFAPMAARDHVAQLLNHPLPTKGMDNAHNFHTRNDFGPNPIPPAHIALPQSLHRDTFHFNKDMKNACFRQKFAKDGGINANWHGNQKNHNSEHNDQMVMFAHIVRK